MLKGIQTVSQGLAYFNTEHIVSIASNVSGGTLFDVILVDGSRYILDRDQVDTLVAAANEA